MFDDITELDSIDLTEIKNQDSNVYANNQKNQKNQSNQNPPEGEGWIKNPKTGQFFKKKEEKIEEPYLPVSVYIDKEFTPDIKEKIYNLISRLINKKITVRLNGDDKEFCDRVNNLSTDFVELYVPWKGFNGIDSKFYYNTSTSKHLANLHFAGWDKIPDVVKAMLARCVRMIFGEKNNSISLCLITWSKDGASKITEVTKETGKTSFIIKMTASYGFPVINLGKQGSENILEKTFNI